VNANLENVFIVWSVKIEGSQQKIVWSYTQKSSCFVTFVNYIDDGYDLNFCVLREIQ